MLSSTEKLRNRGIIRFIIPIFLETKLNVHGTIQNDFQLYTTVLIPFI